MGRMRTLAKPGLGIALAMMVSSPAAATAVITLTQIGGTYDGVGSSAGDTLELAIDYALW